MGLETASYPSELVLTNPVGSSDAKSQGDDHLRLIKTVIQSTFRGLNNALAHVQSKGSNYTVVLTDNFSFFYLTSTGWTLSLTAAATLGNGFLIWIHNGGTGDITIDPDGTETINGQTTLVLRSGQSLILTCNGTTFYGIISLGRIFSATSVGGTVDAITCVCNPNISALIDNTRILVRATGANTITNPTFSPDGRTAKVILKRNLQALSPGDIPGAGFEMDLLYNLSSDNWILLNAPSAKTAVKDHGTQGVNYTLYIDEADLHIIAFSAAVTLTITSRLTNDRATVVVKNGAFAITLAGIDIDAPTLTNAASKQDYLGIIKSFGKITCISYVLNKDTV